MDRRDQEIVAEQIVKGSLLERPHQRTPSLVAKLHVRIHVWNQLRMEPRKFPDDPELRLRAFPQAAFSVAAIQEQAAKGRKLRPTDVEVRRDCVTEDAGSGRFGSDIFGVSVAMIPADVAADDTVAEFRAVKDVRDCRVQPAT